MITQTILSWLKSSGARVMIVGYVRYAGILTTFVHVAEDPDMVGVFVAPWPLVRVWVATVVFRRCQTAIRKLGVGYSSLSCPVYTCATYNGVLSTHVVDSLHIVVVATVA